MAYSLDELTGILGLETPLGIRWTDSVPEHSASPRAGVHSCIIGWLRKARREGTPVHFARNGNNCMGGWHYLGWVVPAPEGIAPFVTTGFGQREGEHYMQEPDDMRRLLSDLSMPAMPQPFCLAQPLPLFTDEEPDLAVFHGGMESLNGLCGLVFFALSDHHAVEMPFGSGCANIFSWPLYYRRRGMKKAVLGGADPSCRLFMGAGEMTLTVPYDILELLLDKAPRSFLAGKTWATVRRKKERSRA